MIIDSHMHMGLTWGGYGYSETLDELLALMDELGIGYCICSAGISICVSALEEGDALARRIYERSGGRVLSYHVYDPRRAEKSLEIMRREGEMYVGIKLHPSFHYTDAADERYRPAWELARERRLPLLSHTWDVSPTNPKQRFSHPSRFVKYLEEYPDVRFIMGHSGGRYAAIKEAVEAGRRFPQVMFDVAGDIHIARLTEYLVENVGGDRVLYGSDWPMMDPRTQLGAVLAADIGDDCREKILWDNAAELFSIEGRKRA